MNDTYFKKVENDDFEKLIHFNEEALNLKQLGKTPLKHHTDASGYTSTSRYLNIEIKDRNQELRQKDDGTYYIHGYKDDGKEYDCEGIYIEQHKVCSMLLDYVVYGYEPIYINFLRNGIVVYNLARLKNRPTQTHQKIRSKGYGRMEIGNREDLSLKDATIYDTNYNIVKRPQ